MMDVNCPHCGNRVAIPDGQLGTTVQCPMCNNLFASQAYGNQSAYPPPPPPQQAYGNQSAYPPPPPPQQAYGNQSAYPPPPIYGNQSAYPPPPPPQQAYGNQSAYPPPQQPIAYKSPGTAVLLSCLLTGLGQMYNGQILKGLVMLVIAAILGCLTFGVGSAVIWIIGMVDASKIADKINSGRIVGDWEFF